MSNLTNFVKTIVADTPTAAGTTAITSDWIDTAGYEGIRFILGLGTITASGTNAIKVIMSAVSAGTSPVDVAGSAVAPADTDDNKAVIIDVYRPALRYCAIINTRGTANTVIDFCVAELYNGRKQAVAKDATICLQEIHTGESGTA